MKTTYINRFLATIVLAMVSSASGWAIDQPGINWNSEDKIITLSCATEGATIYFTVDGTTPTTSSYRYKEPIVVNRRVELRAIAVKGAETSGVSSSNQSGEFRFLNGQFYYRLKDYTLENEVEVTSRTSGIYEGDLVIPPSVTHGGVNYAVTRIGPGAFNNADQVTSITIPNTVTSIGYSAFAEMDKITEIDVPASVKAIDERAFNSSSFSKITLHEGLETIGGDAFGYNRNLTSLSLPSTLKTIGGGALRDCSFYSITIPDGVTSIGTYTFYNCQSLVSVKLPATLAAIPERMFLDCSALRSITIPSTVKSIEEGAFSGCEALTSIVIPDGVATLGNSVCYRCSSLLSATIGEGITTIPNYAFQYCTSLSTVSLPSTLTTIAYSSFNECSSLTSITIPESVTSIEKYAFTKCSKLTSVYALPTTPPTMSNDNDGNAFYDALERATLYVKTAALSNYKNNVRWDEFQTKQTFDQMACAQPTFALADYVLTMSTTTADATIYYTTDGSAPTTSSTQYTAPIYLMKNDTIRAIAVKDGLDNSAISEFMKSNYTVAAPTAVMDEHFVVTIDCESANIEGFPEAEVYYLLDENWSEPYYTDSRWKLYEGPIKLEHPQYVHMYAKRDGWLTSRQAYINCYTNYKLATPGVYWKEETQKAYVADYDVHFANATVHYTIDGTIPTADSPVYNPEDSIFIDHNLTVRAIAMRDGFFDSYMGSYEITRLTTKFVVDDYTYRQIDNNVADEVEITSNINSSKKYSGHVVIPREVTVKVGNTEKKYQVTRIGAGAFSGCSELTGVTLHDGIKSIGAEAFYECYQLVQITLPKNLEEIERYAFYHCNQLQEIDIPGSVKVIRENAFYSCGNLKTLTLHEGLETIENGAFYQCKMTSLTLPNSLKTLGQSAFIYCSALATVKMDCQITEIMSETFSGCESLTSITFPSKLKSIGKFAFANCKALPTVSFPEGFTSIGHGSFTNCFTLTTVVFPESLTTISEIAFERCNSLRTITLPQNLQTIQGAAFRYSALESVYSLATTPPKQGIYDGVYAFHGLTDTATLYVKAEAKDAYNSDLRWSLFTNTQAIEAVPSAQPSFFYDSQTYLLSITATDPSATIYYTRDNSEPTTSSTLYTEPFLLMENDTVKAIAVSAGLGASLVSEFRQANLTVPTPTISFNDDTFVVTLNTEAPDIEGFPETRYYYLLNESDNGNIIPLTDAGWQPLEGNTLQLTRPHFVHIYAVRDGWLSSAQTYKDYYYNYRLYAPQIGWDRTTRTFSLWFYYPNDPASTGDFYYTLDGSEPTKENGILYTEPFTIDRKLTLNARTFADKHFSSDLATYKVTDDIETKFIKDGIYYRFKDYTVDNEVEVTSVNANTPNYTGDITIPETVTYNNKEYRVVGIYKSAFYNSSVTSVTLPSSIQYISNYAFNYCVNLTNIEIKSGVKTIGNAAFNRCSSLTDVDIPATVESLGSEAFRDCYALQRVTLHDGITSLGSACFQSCSKLSTINLPTTLTSIGESCFYACSQLRTLEWPASVTTIDRYVFYDAGITHLTLPETVTSIGQDAIRECKSLQAITLPAGLKTLGNDAFAFDEALTSIVIPEGVTELPSELFVYCVGLSSVQLPSTLKVIGEGAFRECPKLTSIVLPESLTNINNRAFENCSGLKSIYSLAVEPPTIGNDATFAVVKGQATIYVDPASVEAYKEKQYWDEFVPRIVGSTQVATEQPTFVLENYKLALSSLTPNAAIYYTRDGAEPTTSSLRYKEPLIFTQNDTVRAIAIADGMAPSPIAEYSQKSLKVAAPVANIDNETFKVTITCETPDVEGMPDTRIYYVIDQSYYGRSDGWILYDGEPIQMTFPGYIHMYAEREGWVDSEQRYDDFYSNYKLDAPSIRYESNRKKFAIKNNDAEAQVYYTLDGSEPTKENGILYTDSVAINRNLLVKAIVVRDQHFNSVVSEYQISGVDSRFMQDGIYYQLVDNTTADEVEVTSGATPTGSITIPQTVTTPEGKTYTVVGIGTEAFLNCDKLTAIQLPSTLRFIKKWGFLNCYALSGISLPEGFESFGYGAISSCRNITSFTMPSTVTEIAEDAFENCQFTTVTIPAGVKRIGRSAFSGVPLTEVRFSEGLTSIDYSAFSGTKIKTIDLPSTLREIGHGAFSNNKELASIAIPEGITNIEYEMFKDCSALTNVTLPASVTDIGNCAFQNCSSLVNIILPEKVSYIGQSAFNGCSALERVYSLNLTPPTMHANKPFRDIDQQATLYVKVAAKAAYQGATQWGDFSPRIETFTNVPCDQPTFSYSDFVLTIKSKTEDVDIYYTTDGTEPTINSIRYDGPISFVQNDTIRAMAIGEHWGQSPTSEFRKSDFKVATPTAAISNDFVVTLSCEAPNVEGMPKTKIYYNQNRTKTTAGSEWTLYTEPFKMYTANHIHVKAVREGWIDSDVSHNDYYTNYYLEKPSITPQYTSISYMPADTTVTISHSKADAQIYYTLDGSDPNVSGVLYTAPVKLTHNSIVTAIAKRAGAINSDPEQREYKWFTVPMPTITIEHLAAVMTVEKPQHARIYYTLDNSTPTAESKLYTEPVALTQDCKIKAIAIADDWNDSSVGTFNSTTGFVKKNYTVVTPAFNSKQVIDGVMKENADSVLTITTSTAGATIYYTLDGSTPTINSSKYENGIKLTENCKVKVFAVKEDMFNSEQIEADVEWLQVKQPHISFNGKYVEMSVDTEDAVIYYTIDGTNPDTKSKAYQKPFMLEAEETSVKAIAVRANWNNSEYSSLTYNPGKNYCEAPGITRVAGTNKIQMTTRTEGATIYYTIDGLNPTVNSTAYTTEVEVTENCTVKAMAVESQLYDSEVASYTVDWFRATQPTITSDGIFVSITSTQENAKIYYTLDGTDPTTNSSLYEGTLTMKSTCTIKAIAAKDNFNSSTVAVLNYYSTENACATPIFAKAGNNVSITSAPEDGTTIYYTTDGSTPTTGSEVFTAPIEVIQNGIIKALAVNPKLFQSEIGEYEVNWFKVETPVISQNGSVVSITCSTPNTTIYYSFEGDPFVDGTPYSGPVTLVDNRTLQVVATRANFNNSEIATLTPDLFVCDPVTFSYNGRYLQMETTEGMTIRFTTDGSKPTGESEAYTAPVDINALCTVRAIATRKDFRDSQETSYTVDYLYNGEEVSLNEAGKLEEVFQWMGGTENLETLPVKGKINDQDLTFIRNVKALRHLDLSAATYEGDKIPDEAFANLPLLSISIPKQVTSVGEHLFKGCENLAAIVWNADITIPQSVIDDIKNPNMLLYVNSRIYAPTNFQGNLISGGEATSITLTDAENGGNFCCPQRFYTQRISYTHTYSQTTKSGSTRGWETLALPFDVQTITHENRGAMAPFAKEEDIAAFKPFWLYELQETGFSRAAEIKAYTPYIVSMPNDPDYADDYILAGKVTFSATGTYVEADTTKVTMKGSVRFTPSMQHQEKGESVLAINKEAYTDENGAFHESGSMFVRNSRDVRPFEAYALVNSAGVKAMFIGDYLWGGATDIRDAEMMQLKEIGKNKGIYDMSGKLLSPDSNYFKEKPQHRNIFIINGQKTMVK